MKILNKIRHWLHPYPSNDAFNETVRRCHVVQAQLEQARQDRYDEQTYYAKHAILMAREFYQELALPDEPNFADSVIKEIESIREKSKIN
jgi:hypothetical protein